MEALDMIPMDPTRRPAPTREGIEAYQAAAWRAPAVTRFDSRPANDFLGRAEAIAPVTLAAQSVPMEPMPRWIVIAIGAVIAAVLGALLGGALSV